MSTIVVVVAITPRIVDPKCMNPHKRVVVTGRVILAQYVPISTFQIDPTTSPTINCIVVHIYFKVPFASSQKVKISTKLTLFKINDWLTEK